MLMNYETSGQLPNGKFEAFGWWNCVSGYTLVDMHAVFVPGNEVFFHTSSLFFHVCVIWVGQLGVTSWNSQRTMGWTFCNILFSNLGGFVDELHFFEYYIFLYWVFRQ